MKQNLMRSSISPSSLRAVRFLALAIVATTTTTTTTVFAQSDFADQKPDPGCSSKVSCIECLEAPCTWYGLGTCLDLESVLADVPRYSLDDGGTVESVCQEAANDKADADLCSSKFDCASCFDTVLSDGAGTCLWFGEMEYCGSGCNMMGCGSKTCNDDRSRDETTEAVPQQPPVGQDRPVGQPVVSPTVPNGGFLPQPPVGPPVGQPVAISRPSPRPVGPPAGQPVDGSGPSPQPVGVLETTESAGTNTIPDASDSPPPVDAPGDSSPEATDSSSAEASSGGHSTRSGTPILFLVSALIAMI